MPERLGDWEGVMTGSLTSNDVDVASLLRILQTDVIVRYMVKRPQRDCNYQYFYAEVLDLWRKRRDDMWILQHFTFNIQVDMYVKDRSCLFLKMPAPTDYEGVRQRMTEIATSWEEQPSPWRRNDAFVGLLYIGDTRQQIR